MGKQDVIDFFNRCAPDWDKGMVRNEAVIAQILQNVGDFSGADVLDVACGTGVLIPDYLARGVHSVTGIDISPEMIRCASAKFPQERVKLICGDVEMETFTREFDICMVYNAFPHFSEPERLLEKLAAIHVGPGMTFDASILGGRVCIAHGMSRAMLDRHHSGSASKVSVGLMHEDELAALLRRWFDVDVIVSDEQMYQVAGTKR